MRPDGSITVAWEEAGSGRILRQSFSLDGHPADAAPAPLTLDRLMAWGLPSEVHPMFFRRVTCSGRRHRFRVPTSELPWSRRTPDSGAMTMGANFTLTPTTATTENRHTAVNVAVHRPRSQFGNTSSKPHSPRDCKVRQAVAKA